MKIFAYLGIEQDMAEGVMESASSGPEVNWFWLAIGAAVLVAFVWAGISGFMEGLKLRSKR